MDELPPLQEWISRLQDRLRLHFEAGEKLLGCRAGRLVCSDMLAAAVLNRSMGLVRGFCALIADNYVSAAPLVRLQLDNLLRFSALWLVEDADRFMEKLLAGEPINKFKDRDNQQLTDRRLVEKLNERYPGVDDLYGRACGYVHLSEAHLYHTIVVTGERSLRIEIGADNGVTEADRKEAVLVMDQMTRLLLSHIKLYLHEHGRLVEAR